MDLGDLLTLQGTLFLLMLLGAYLTKKGAENAPINTIADYVINGTVEEVIPKMIKYYKSHSK